MERKMKAILVIDEMPGRCGECRFVSERDWLCQLEERDAEFGCRPSWCPLKPLPGKKTEEEEKAKDPYNEDLFYDDYIRGWNDCLEEITGVQNE